MISVTLGDNEGIATQYGCFTATLSAIVSFLRGLPRFVFARPKSPLRVLCLMAFDTFGRCRNSRRLSSDTLETLATLLDFGACVNAFFDDKDFSRQEYRATRRLLAATPEAVLVNDYLNRLRDLENRRPSPGGGLQQYREVQSYRESVIRMSLGVVAAAALENVTIDDGIQATYHDSDLETLYRIVMLCQIIDDVLDFATDADGKLPTFLTAHASPLHALALTSEATAEYADGVNRPTSPPLYPFRIALLGTTVLAKLAIWFGRWRRRVVICSRPCGES